MGITIEYIPVSTDDVTKRVITQSDSFDLLDTEYFSLRKLMPSGNVLGMDARRITNANKITPIFTKGQLPNGKTIGDQGTAPKKLFYLEGPTSKASMKPGSPFACDGSTVPPILKFNTSGTMVKSFARARQRSTRRVLMVNAVVIASKGANRGDKESRSAELAGRKPGTTRALPSDGGCSVQAPNPVGRLQNAAVLILACGEGRVENVGPGAQASLYGPIFPAIWSFMLALRARGIGSVMTTEHIAHSGQGMATIVRLPDGMTQLALLAVAYCIGADFKPAKRAPTREGTHWERWRKNREGG